MISVHRGCGLTPLQVYSRGISWTIHLQTSRVRKSSKELVDKGLLLMLKERSYKLSGQQRTSVAWSSAQGAEHVNLES